MAKVQNFQSKSERKEQRKEAIRKAELKKKGMDVRGNVANKIADAKMARQERIDFYRRLRQAKITRKQIARECIELAEQLRFLAHLHHRETSRCDHDLRLSDEAAELIKSARVQSEDIADQFQALATQRIFYSKWM